ncbi:subtilisin-like protease SBT1.7 [Gossypium australe]|uniref:Subtilisin-like protease SBT1.7 n=1 Tax=Gossypium australe TaxID=47621 RepID=A0A5B6V1C3_9ROSI|nr:subtilisin-like protease SBT1.7 [Gossypium australe]
MERLTSLGLIISLFLFFPIATSLPASGRPRTYIIHMDKSAMPGAFLSHHDWYMSTLSSLSSPDGFSPLHLYTYNHVMDGFSAVLSQAHLDQLHELPGHLATYPETIGHLHTTRAPTFLGLKKHSGLWPAGGFGEDMIIGVLDSGIWPESESFNDEGLPPVPKRWRGMQQEKQNISKTNDYDSPRDFLGHGSHTSSIAAGSSAVGAEYFGYAKGKAIGMAPKARIAMYKVLFFDESYDAAATDVLAGMDQAIEDGVDVMSLSLGFIETPFDENPIAVGAFAALKKGIFVSCSAGNNGPHAYTILNGAPWITTVGAGTIDREFAAHVTLGDGELTVTGKSVYPENLFVSDVPIYFGHGNRSKELCNSLDPKEVAGKYVFCDFDSSGQTNAYAQIYEMDTAGAAGAIFSSSEGPFFRPTDFFKPFVLVNPKYGDLVKHYIINSKNATVSIRFQTTLLGTKPAPQVAYFSSRGPDRKSPWILKPDILAPGVDILAAWVPNRGFAPIDDDDYLLTDYALESGTSMSCPHAAGIATLLKAAHRDWSSAAIRSAMMTTADVIDNANGRIIDMTTGVAGTPLDFGAGHINPNKAMDPGLVYDIEIQDYINYLCGLNYTSKQIRTITGMRQFNCDSATLDLNYPSFIILLNNTNTTSATFQRELTNVAEGSSVYRAVVRAPSGMKAVVQPATITFAGKYSKAKFQLTVEIDVGVGSIPESDYFGNYGFLSWYEVNGKHQDLHHQHGQIGNPAAFSSHHGWYTSSLSSLSSPDGFSPLHLYTYNHVMDGFSAVLSQAHLDQLHELPGHLATYPETFGHLHTTHTPTFLGLRKHSGLWPASGFGDDMIIGVLDTGIWPESESFNDEGFPPVPERWRGACEIGTEFNSSYCNKKLIGARSFSKGMQQEKQNISKTNDYDSPRDFIGHGSHTSSTAAGSSVVGAEYFGYAKGKAIGMAPKARIAMYKVLFFDESYDAAATDVLAGMDQAIEDGVDSLGFIETPFDENPIAVGAFAALKKGIFVSCSAGNNGPHAYTILNGAPWITTAGAGTIDREFAAHVTLGDGELTVTGKSVYPENLLVSDVPIFFGHGNRTKELCEIYSLDPEEVAGKYIFCDFDSSGQNNALTVQNYEMDRSGAVGAIFSSDEARFFRPTDFFKPFVLVNPKDGDLVKDYIINSKNATVSIRFLTTLLGTKPAPQVADFSSRGPDRISPWILKPDILAPGVDILAAWAPNRGFVPIGDYDYLLTDYAIVSGTSMSCPHAAGIATLLKATHRDWSSAAIRSAMMTTADVTDNANGRIIDMITGVTGTPLDFGAGHINPNKAIDPGLVYDIEIQDYINYLCGLNYTSKQIRTITGMRHFKCDSATLDLNYPSFIILLNNTKTTSITFARELTNVAEGSSVYRAVVRTPSGMKAVVQPETITFARKYSKAKFQLTVDIDVRVGSLPKSDSFGNYGFLSWYEVNGKHEVRSPIVSAFAP